MACPGASGSMCGGDLANSIYRVYRGTHSAFNILCHRLRPLHMFLIFFVADDRYMGCWFESVVDPDMTEMKWAVGERKSTRECIDECSRSGFSFAGQFLLV